MTTETTQRPGPRFVGVDTYIDSHGRFTFRYPTDWYHYPLQEGLEGAMYSPQAQNPQTWFSAWVVDLKEKVVAEDLPVLRQGVEQGLAKLKDVQIEESKDDALSNLVKFERIFTFRDGDATRKWKQWQLYVDHWLMVVTYQGESPEEYDYWLPIGNYLFHFFHLPEALWFAVDRDLTGTLAKPDVSPDNE